MFCTPRAKVAPDDLQQRYRALQGDFKDLQQKYRALQFRNENLCNANEALKARLTRSERTSTSTIDALNVKVRDQMYTISIEVLRCSHTKDELKQAKANIEVLTQRVQNVNDEMTLERERAAELLYATVESLNDANARNMAGATAEIRALKVYKSKFTFLRLVYRLKKTKFPFIDLLHCYGCFESKNHSRFSVMPCGHCLCTSCMTDWHRHGHANCPACDKSGDYSRLFLNVEEQDD